MQTILAAALTTAVAIMGLCPFAMVSDKHHAAPTPQVLHFTVKDIDGHDVDLARYAGKVVLIVNVASKCGYTPQYKGLEALHEKYAPKGLAILAFPCNQFAHQEPGTPAQIKQFCDTKYHVKFDLFAKIDVNGPGAAPLYKYLTSGDAPVSDRGPVKWNFEKFLVSRDGRLLDRYRSRVTPEKLEEPIERALSR